MRERFVKKKLGKAGKNRKEVTININKGGLTADGSQRWAVVARFTPDARKKISTTEWCVPELDREGRKLYFTSATSEEGYKLTASSSGSEFKSISFTVPDVEEWSKYVGSYSLKKDIDENLYYIDLPN